MQELYLFPLSAHILPGGKLSLRIFEPRYVRMVKECCAGNKSFGICMLSGRDNSASSQKILPVGTQVEVVDFTQLEDGLLGITVRGLNFFTVHAIESEKDGLRVGQCEMWQEPEHEKKELDMEHLSTRLHELFGSYPELSSLYDRLALDDPRWVMYRWIELLPIAPEEKQNLIADQQLQTTHLFLTDLIK